MKLNREWYVDEKRIDALFDKYAQKIGVININAGMGPFSGFEVFIPIELVREYCKILGLSEEGVRADGLWHLLNLKYALGKLPNSQLEFGDGDKEDKMNLERLLKLDISGANWTDNFEENDTRLLLEVTMSAY
jgi:hypothetical protein